MSTIAKAVTADYEILVKLQDGGAVPNLPAFMKVGETVHYKSDDGEVTIEFHENGSPYLNADGSEKTEVSSNEPPTELKKRGNFTCHCFITPPRIGWRAGYPAFGGNHEVR
jgi:hypothetical protein